MLQSFTCSIIVPDLSPTCARKAQGIYAEYSPEPNLNTCRATIGTTGLIIKSYSMVIKHNVW